MASRTPMPPSEEVLLTQTLPSRQTFPARRLLNLVTSLIIATAVITGLRVWAEANPYVLGTILPFHGTSVYIGTSKRLIAIDNTNGVIRWQAALPATSFVAQSDVILVPRGNDLTAINGRDGSIRWHVAIPNISGDILIKGQLAYVTSITSSADKSHTIMTVAAYDLQTGKERWHFSPDDQAIAAQVIIGSQIYVAALPEATSLSAVTLHALDPQTGGEIWHFTVANTQNISTYLAGNTLLVIARLNTSGTPLVGYVLDPLTGATRWTSTEHSRAVALDREGKTIFWADQSDQGSEISAQDIASGTTRWSQTITVGTITQFQAIGDIIFIVDADLTSQVIDTQTGATVLSSSETLTPLVNPIVDDTSFYFGHKNSLRALAISDGALRWNTQLASADAVVTPLGSTTYQGAIYVTAGNNIVAVATDSGKVRWRTPITYDAGTIWLGVANT